MLESDDYLTVLIELQLLDDMDNFPLGTTHIQVVIFSCIDTDVDVADVERFLAGFFHLFREERGNAFHNAVNNRRVELLNHRTFLFL